MGLAAVYLGNQSWTDYISDRDCLSAFGKAIVELSQQPDHCAELARNCRGEMAARYSLCLQAECYAKLYLNALAKRKTFSWGRLECSGRNFFASEY